MPPGRKIALVIQGVILKSDISTILLCSTSPVLGYSDIAYNDEALLCFKHI